MGLRITSWNVNGIRNPFGYQPWRENRTFQAMFDTLEADIVVMQETKIQRKDLQDDMVLVPGWDVYFSLPKHKKGYSGVAIYTRTSKCCPIRAEEGITGVLCAPGSSTKFRDLPPDQQIGGYPPPDALAVEDTVLDSEGRCVVLEFPAFVLLGLYCPATRDATRTEFREAFLDALDLRVRNLISLGKHVVLCGDLNIIRSELDTAGLAEALRKENIPLDDWLSSPARRLFNHLVFGGRVVGALDPGREQPVLWDLGRAFHPTRAGMYTCWETKKNARPGNYGSRIDYVLCSADRRGWFVDANIQEGLLGSDHCPVYATLAATVATPERGQVAIEDFMNPVGMFRDGVRLREWSPKDILPTSARLLPEFDRRRNIRDMFQPKPKETPVVTTPAADTTMPDLPAPPLSSPAGEALSVLPRRTPPVESAAPLKRPAKPASVPSKKAKLAKEAPASKSQQSLMGFFKPTPPAERPTLPDAEPPSSGTPGGSQVSYPGMRSERDAKPEGRDASDDDGQRVIDPFVSRESWSKLLGRRTPPKCEHGDECQMLTTKKPGMNRGRSFFMCARPLGPSGDKEQGTEFRCRTFIWGSDWK